MAVQTKMADFGHLTDKLNYEIHYDAKNQGDVIRKK